MKTFVLFVLDFLHKSKIVKEFLGETKPSTAAYIDVREERRQVSTTKLPTRLTYAGSLLYIIYLSSSIAIASEAKFPNQLNRCKISKSTINDYEPEEFQSNNNLLRKTGEEAVYSGIKIIVKGKLLDQNCVPVSDAKIYLWQVGSDGKYPYKPLRTKTNKNMLRLTNNSTFTGSGTATTNNKGEFYFLTIYPGKNPNRGRVNLRVEHRDLGTLQTQLSLTKKFANPKNCGEINHVLSEISRELTIYDFDIVMPGRTLRRY